MPDGDFQYKPLNGSKRPKKSPFKNFPRFKMPDFKKNGKLDYKTALMWIGIGFAGLFLVGIIAFALLIAIVSIGLPSVHDLDNLYVAQSTTIYDREGNVLYVKYGGENREFVPYEKISNHVINATVAIEDDQYWNHSGFDLVGITRAFVNNLTGGSQQGGSTLTQQYIKNAFLSPEKTYTRKLKELILAIQLEQAYSKEEILELYLNKIPYGNNAFGVEKAAEVYFNKNAKDLDLAESTVLASLPKAPSYYNPYGAHRYSDLATTFTEDELKRRNIRSEADLQDNEFLRGLIGKNIALNEENTVYIQGRTDLVLKIMQNLGYIDEQEKEQALQELQQIEFKKHHEKMQAPHFVFHVLEKLEAKYGKEIVEQGGLQVYTTLDPSLQDYAQEAIDEVAPLNKEKYNAKNAALTSLDPKTGQILAMIGSVDYFSDEIDGAVNITTSYKQPGSSFKPIVYAKAFYNRYAPASVIFDVRTEFGSGAYPDNYDGKFMGPISIRKALAQSRNIPAIKAYFLAEEQEGIIDLAEKMGLKFLNKDIEYGWPLALGTGEVRQLDLASAFGVFANNGVRHKPVAILKVTNAKGETLEEWSENEGEEVLDPQIAYLITHILSDSNVNVGPLLNVAGHDVAAKTGTANKKKRDGILPSELWTAGYSPNLVAVAWAGNNSTKDGDISTTAAGYVAAAPIWNKFMTKALADSPSGDFAIPKDIVHKKINRLTGKLPGPNTPDYLIVDEIFADFSVPTEVDDSYTMVKIDTRNNKLANEYCPEKFTKEKAFITIPDIAPYPSWQEGADAWMAENAAKLFGGETTEEDNSLGDVIIGTPPSSTSELCTKDRFKDKPQIKIRSPKAEETIETGSAIKVQVKITSKNGIEETEYYLDDTYKYKTSDAPYTGIIRLPKSEQGKNYHIITVKAIDKYGYSSEQNVQIITSDKIKNKDDADVSPTEKNNTISPETEEEQAETTTTEEEEEEEEESEDEETEFDPALEATI